MEYSKEQERLIAHRLVEHVKTKKVTIYYLELSKKPGIEIEPNGFHEYLAIIGENCKKQSFPLLSSVVINKREQRPGIGFYRQFYPELLADEEKKYKQAREDQQQVFSFNEWDRFLEIFYVK